MTDLERIEEKLDLIIDALGLGRQRLSPSQVDEKVDSILLQFRQKRAIKNDHVRSQG